jgi:hypothetical protein
MNVWWYMSWTGTRLAASQETKNRKSRDSKATIWNWWRVQQLWDKWCLGRTLRGLKFSDRGEQMYRIQQNLIHSITKRPVFTALIFTKLVLTQLHGLYQILVKYVSKYGDSSTNCFVPLSEMWLSVKQIYTQFKLFRLLFLKEIHTEFNEKFRQII